MIELDPMARNARLDSSEIEDDELFNGESIYSHLSYVYFIRAGRMPMVKIGSALEPEKRLESLQIGNPQKLHLIGYSIGGMPLERQWHQDWKHRRIRGEWFTLRNDLRAAINEILTQPLTWRFMTLKIDRRENQSRLRTAGEGAGS